jgi:predicted small lipoprotein YifL
MCGAPRAAGSSASRRRRHPADHGQSRAQAVASCAIWYGGADWECFSVNLACLRLLAPVLALGLAGCGVKGPLEPPPSANIHPNAVAEHPATVPVTPEAAAERRAAAGTGAPIVPGALAGYSQPPASSAVARTAKGTTSDAVVEAPASQRRSVLDWLID